jgi:hypothetical protein
MGYLTTALDLKRDALWLAGEPVEGASSYDSLVYEWLTVVLRTLIAGGKFGPSPLQPVDWLWARAWPRGAIQLMQPINANGTYNAVFSIGTRDVTTTPMLPAGSNLAGYRIQQDQTPARQLVVVSQNDQAANRSYVTLSEPWTGQSMTTASWLAYPDTYELPTDFVRGTSPLFIQAFPSFGLPYTIDVVDPPDLERYYPQAWPMASGRSMGGLPVVAARVTETKLRFSHYLNTPDTPLPVQIEFEYIRRPDVLGEGSVPPIPIEHRRILSYGCAYLILADKDDSTATSLWQQFEAQWRAMLDDYRRGLRRMSTRWGVVQPSRLSGAWGVPRWTSGGLPVWTW